MLFPIDVAHGSITGYTLGDVLGRGGMGTVYAAHQPALDRTVAIKILHPELATDPAIVARFHTEAVAAGRLAHPNVAGVIECGVSTTGHPYLVMEHVAGERLGAIVDREGAFPSRRACELVGQVLDALAATHAAGVVHADVKCDNLMVETTRTGREIAVLIDFGIARLVDRVTQHDEPSLHMLSGTPEYIAPEVIAGAAPTPVSDLYATGVVLYELLTGCPPFRGDTTEEIFQSHLSEEAVAPSLRCPEAGIPSALDRVVLRALAKDPAQRFATAAQFAQQLEAATPTHARERAVARRPAGFSSEAATQDWPVAESRRLADGTGKPARDRAERLRAAIRDAILAGDPSTIATAYLDLARALVASHRADLATRELEQAIDIITAGEGPATPHPPSSLWRVLLVLAAIYDGAGKHARAKLAAIEARNAAARAASSLGVERAHGMMTRLATPATTSTSRPT